MSNYPPGVTDDDPHFDMSSVGDDEESDIDDRKGGGNWYDNPSGMVRVPTYEEWLEEGE